MSSHRTHPATPFESGGRRLSRTECQDWLTSHREGRLGYSSGCGPRSVVVSYAVADEQIMLRLPEYNDIVNYAPGAEITLDVDEEQTETRPGHETVSVSGTAERANSDDDLGGVEFPESWPDGVGTTVVRLPLTAVEGFERGDR